MKHATELQIKKLHKLISEKKQNADIEIPRPLGEALGIEAPSIKVNLLLRLAGRDTWSKVTSAQMRTLMSVAKKLPAKRIHCGEEFELCYLRHKYLRKVKRNPSQKDMQPFMKISSNFARRTFFTYKSLFYVVGLEQEDLVNIANVHLVSFLGLFSLQRLPEKYKAFVSYCEDVQGLTPTKDDILNKDKASFTQFLKQRMEDVVRVCRQKGKNVKGIPVDGFYYYAGPTKPPYISRELIKDYEKLGFRKIDSTIFKAVRKQAKPDYDMLFKFKTNWYIAVPLDKTSLKMEDFSGADLNPYDNVHNMNPEDVYLASEENKTWENNLKEFDGFSSEDKRTVIMNFIKESKANPEYQEELKAARKLLKRLD